MNAFPELKSTDPQTVAITRAVANTAMGVLGAVRPRDFSARMQPLARLSYAVASGAVSWLTSTKAYLGPVISAETEGAKGANAKQERAIDIGVAVASGALSWATWNLSGRILDKIDDKLTPVAPRLITAVASGATMWALTSLLERAVMRFGDDWYATTGGYLEIALPLNARDVLEAMIEEGAQTDPATAAVVREQLAAARFFVNYDGEPDEGEPTPEWAANNADFNYIDITVPADLPRIAPADQTYPVRATFTGSDGIDRDIQLSIAQGRISQLLLVEADDESFAAEVDMPVGGAPQPGLLIPSRYDVGEAVPYESELSFDLTDDADEGEVGSGELAAGEFDADSDFAADLGAGEDEDFGFLGDDDEPGLGTPESWPALADVTLVHDSDRSLA